MKNIARIFMVAACVMTLATSCIKEILPQTSTVTASQAAAAPGAYDNFVSALTSTLAGQFIYGGNSNTYLYDFGYPALAIQRDLMGQDMVYAYQNWFTYWYIVEYLGPSYRFSQMPWTYYYGWIKSCNTVISLAFEGKEEGADPDADKVTGAGIAYAMRAFFYMDLARLFAQESCVKNPESVSVPIVTESTSLDDLSYNPRATNTDMWNFIISDLDKAEKYLEGYKRKDVYTPDQSVVFGLKARAYLEMGKWSEAVTYAQKAQVGYKIMDEEEYTSWDEGFNTPNSSWMFGCTFKSDDPAILLNDADSSWGSVMCMEINPETSGCGYAANYGQAFFIDRHLYETIPASDFRKKCYIDFAIDDMDEDAQLEALAEYSAHPDWLYGQHEIQSDYNGNIGGIELKFRTAGGEAGRNNQYIGFVVAYPFMRVEEMALIEAEAAGRLNEADGIAKLTAFAQTRDPYYSYGHHTDAYGNTTTSTFLNEIWWQRRVEFWGEGLATFDIKRFDKGIIRSYEGSNHPEEFQYNYLEGKHPEWMDYCIVQTETNYNYECTNNPDPTKPEPASPFEW